MHAPGSRRTKALGLAGSVMLVAGVAVASGVAPMSAGASVPGGTPSITPSVLYSGTLSDAGTVVGNVNGGTPTGNLGIFVCHTGSTQTLTPASCDAVLSNHLATLPLTAGTGFTANATSPTFTPSSAGTWCFSLVYSGDTNYNSSADNTTGANLDANECVVVGTAPSTSASRISAVSVTLGQADTVNDIVTVGGALGVGSPTGTVQFFVCQTGTTQTLMTGPCAATGTPEDTETLIAGAGNTASATSTAFSPTSAGTWCFGAVYSGDPNYSGSEDNTSAANLDTEECVLVTPASTTTATTISSATVSLGPAGTVTDAVTVSGNAVGGPPTGQVQFFACQTGSSSQTPTTGPCPASGPATSTASLAAASSSTSGATSPTFTPTSVGTWCFGAVYGGDSNYNGSEDNTSASNLDPSECVLVTQATSSTATTISKVFVLFNSSGTVTDSVTVTGNALGGPPTGQVQFFVCQTGSSSQAPTTGPCPASGPATSTTSLGPATSSTSSATSSTFTPPSEGTWCFSAVYGGDPTYSGSQDNTSVSTFDPSECVLVSNGAVTSTNAAEAIVGVPFSYTVTAAGVSTPSIKKIGKLPSQIRPLVDLHNGTASLAGTARPGQGGVYHVTIVATFKQGKARFSSSQVFTLTVLEAPTFKSGSHAVAHIGAPFTFVVKTRGYPAASPVTETGALPSGITFTSNGDGTATLAGTAGSSDAPGTYSLTIGASNGVGSPASQTFLLRLAG
ncbi:MAG TPA: hypothetical protein VMU09_01170 [Acidimicrobiales bacterium]|nr:hypothetical protein [Acidimicrobiales bacterium]